MAENDGGIVNQKFAEWYGDRASVPTSLNAGARELIAFKAGWTEAERYYGMGAIQPSLRAKALEAGRSGPEIGPLEDRIKALEANVAALALAATPANLAKTVGGSGIGKRLEALEAGRGARIDSLEARVVELEGTRSEREELGETLHRIRRLEFHDQFRSRLEQGLEHALARLSVLERLEAERRSREDR